MMVMELSAEAYTKWEQPAWEMIAKTSVLNKWNQVWDAPNVFVTDGSFMVSANCCKPIINLYGNDSKSC